MGIRGATNEEFMNNQTVVVTGASSGIGRAIAEAFLTRGATVAVCARRVERLHHLFGNYDRAFVRQVDVRDVEQIRTFVTEVDQRFNGIDVLVNNAGVAIAGTVEEIECADWERAYRINVEAPFLFCKFVVPGMKRRNYGRIVNMSSGGSVNCAPGYSVYASTKAALNAFTRSLSKELQGTDVKANMMSPGPCRTEMFPDAPLAPEAAVPTALYLATLPADGPNGRFFWAMQEVQIMPDLSHIDWSDPSSLDRPDVQVECAATQAHSVAAEDEP